MPVMTNIIQNPTGQALDLFTFVVQKKNKHA